MTATPDLGELGRRIRSLRIDRQMTLKQVEEASGLSATHLSEIERGRTSPTIGALIRVARALQKEPAYFLELEERADVAHTPRGSGRSVEFSRGVIAELMSPGIPGSEISAYRFTFSASAPGELWLSPRESDASVLYYVVGGSLEGRVGPARFQISTGDAVQAPLSHPHRFKARGGEPAEMVAVTTLPLEGTRADDAARNGGENP